MVSLRDISRAVSYGLARKRLQQIAERKAEQERLEAERIADLPRLERLRKKQARDKRSADRWRERHDKAVATATDLAAHLHVEGVREAEAQQAELCERIAARNANLLRQIAERDAAAVDVGGVRAAAKVALARQIESEWNLEQQRRALSALDIDGEIAEAKRLHAEQLEQERLDFLAAQLVRRTA